jgi:hypothetical protein
MLRTAAHVLLVAAVAAALVGCGSKKSASPPTITRLTSAVDVAACNHLETDIRLVSQLISSSVQAMTQSLHPKDLAKRTGETQRYLLLAASALSRLRTPASLVPAQHQLVDGLQLFAADFGRAQRSVSRNDLPTAARQLVDRPALAKVTAATKQIDGACGA